MTEVRARAYSRTCEDHTVKLPVEIIHITLDFLRQPDVLRAAAFSKRWRTVAITHPSFYRSIRLYTTEKDFFSVSGYPKFCAALTEAIADATVRVALDFQLDQWFTISTDVDSIYSTLKNETASLISAILPRVKTLHLNIRDKYRSIVFEMLRQPAPSIESLVLIFSDTQDLDAASVPSSSGDTSSDDGVCLPRDIFASHAPRLNDVNLCGVRLCHNSVTAFSSVRRVRLFCRTPLRFLSIPHIFPRAKDLTLRLGSGILPKLYNGDKSGYSARVIKLPNPETLHRLTFEPVINAGQFVFDLLANNEISQIRTLTVDLHGEYPEFDWMSILRGLSGPWHLNVVSEPMSNQYSRDADDTIVALRLSNGVVERNFSYCRNEIVRKAYVDGPYKIMFLPLQPLRHNITTICVLHEYLSALFRVRFRYYSLHRLEIKMDSFREPFWAGTNDVVDEEEDEAEREFQQLKWNLLRNRGGEIQPDRHSQLCPALQEIVLHSSSSRIEIKSEQLTFFGLSLNLDENLELPIVVMRGVTLAPSSHENLHVFREVINDVSFYASAGIKL